jgi:hypothetical protein
MVNTMRLVPKASSSGGCNVQSSNPATVQKQAPQFEGMAVVDGEFKKIKLDDYKGKYVVLFFYPLDL